jgi:phosphatidylserine/phosphatidylglycerophosphate/cardiolipin synthase-like enzyme
MNWTRDSWSREENLILQAPSPALAGMYRADFEELWQSGEVEGSGAGAGGSTQLQYQGQTVPTRLWFSPVDGMTMAHDVADAIRGAARRVVVASPVLTDGSILGALRDLAASGRLSLTGVYDGTQMQEAEGQWQDSPQSRWKIDAFREVAAAGGFASKASTPYAPNSVHDYLHIKTIVVDDTVYAGSYNFSHSGEDNAENLLQLSNGALADRCAGFIAHLIERYGRET